ncbi:amino acid dehydrogenase [Sphingomonas changnyeongensis]|uniref:Amino acid dehydrogenase n=1 Tax=Sphingomonas changnyeongensis TaxID=2698679 RepID=A0A7Z2NV10_9SPHN|nr:Glu/Leu/Phe/Val dehydrogenase [Sphingomonas changnyeongensis]QHL89966.1 amino acid dehydrogenase [Sphingomonas changnyeongensis]
MAHLPTPAPHEAVHLIEDPETGLHGVIAIHSTALGPAAGGCRLWQYDDDAAMLADALRLARGMSYKNALAGLPFGGGKAVIRMPATLPSRARLFAAFGRAVAGLGGAYVTAEDVGTTTADMAEVRAKTRFVAGLPARPGQAGGDPSPWTALGVFVAMEAAARSLGTGLSGLRVAVQGVGQVGAALCTLLHEAGARLVVADADAARAAAVAARFGADMVSPGAIIAADADIFAPCALGGALDRQTIAALRARLVCGAANNQLATPEDGARLAERGILYAPDYVANAGGIINVAAEYLGEAADAVEARVRAIGPRMALILVRAGECGETPAAVADAMAEAIMAEGRAGLGRTGLAA